MSKQTKVEAHAAEEMGKITQGLSLAGDLLTYLV